ncbi:class I SAM-dependent DNA methyltransferase [Paenibacillus sp. NPDC058071]|uniref:class I SAM-dependent DNA methyltransferase n=1 Tax=Paenibacillus sp. NPDC058071 TaxID=3346326 RepID=UPI0036DEF7DC
MEEAYEYDAYGEFASVYDRLMEDMPYEEWLRFAEACWSRYGKPSSVADLGCGTGSVAIPLALSGMSVYGIDLSPDMLTIASSKWEEAAAGARVKGAVTWLEQDMRDWALPQEVDAVVSFCDCINYLTEESDVEEAFRAAYAGLRSGGLFLFDVQAPSTFVRYSDEQPFVLDEDDVAYIWTCELDEARCEIEHRLTIFASDGGGDERFRRFEEIQRQRAYDPEWMEAALLRAGFSSVDRYADFELKPAGKQAQRLFFAAVK